MKKKEEETLRKLIKEFVEAYAGSQPDESYNKELLDDEAYEAGSVYVPDDIKKKINKWAKDMGLWSGKN